MAKIRVGRAECIDSATMYQREKYKSEGVYIVDNGGQDWVVIVYGSKTMGAVMGVAMLSDLENIFEEGEHETRLDGELMTAFPDGSVREGFVLDLVSQVISSTKRD